MSVPDSVYCVLDVWSHARDQRKPLRCRVIEVVARRDDASKALQCERDRPHNTCVLVVRVNTAGDALIPEGMHGRCGSASAKLWHTIAAQLPSEDLWRITLAAASCALLDAEEEVDLSAPEMGGE